MNIHKKQCRACPWKKSTKPERDIPGGYCEKKHEALERTVAQPGVFPRSDTLHVFACHESPVGNEQACAGWVANQLGPGNNLALRMRAMADREAFKGIVLDGPQHERFEDTLPRAHEDG